MRDFRSIGVVALLTAAAPLFSACTTTGKAKVADYEAEYVYQQDRYERQCFKLGRADQRCHDMFQLLTELSHTTKTPDGKGGMTEKKEGLIPVSNYVQQIGGELPAQQRAEMDAIFKKLRSLP